MNAHIETIDILGLNVELETIPEIIAKKVRFRGANIQPRDVFDIADASDAGYREEIRDALAEISEYRDTAAKRLDALNEDYVNSSIQKLMLKPEFKPTAANATEVAKQLPTHPSMK